MAVLHLDNPLTADADALGKSRLVKLELFAPVADDDAEVSGCPNTWPICLQPAPVPG